MANELGGELAFFRSPVVLCPVVAGTGPYWPLNRVQALVASGAMNLTLTKAQNPIISVLGCSVKQARQYAALVVQGLTPSNYSHTLAQRDVADVYGVVHNGNPWYIKFCIDQAVPEVVCISFHPPQHPLLTIAGVIYP